MKQNQALYIDAFDYYGSILFDSPFTKLKKIYVYKNLTAFFNKECNIIYIVNEQGRLDEKIVMFDKYLKYLDTTNVEEKAIKVVESYFADTKEDFLKKLLDLRVISEKMYYKANIYRGKYDI